MTLLDKLLGEILAVIELKSPFSDDCRQRLDRIPWNRAKKHRRRRLQFPGRLHSSSAQDVSAIEVADSVDQVRGMLSSGEWEVECRLAAGQSYAEVALDCGLSPDTLKVRAGRWRARIRRQMVVYRQQRVVSSNT
jgi:DNA-directed RNA polymerase specialized sigma24 family protein